MLFVGILLVLIGLVLGLAFAVVYWVLLVVDWIKDSRYRAANMPEVRQLIAEWHNSATRPPAGRHRLQPDTGRHHLRRAA